MIQSVSHSDKKKWLNEIGLIKISFCLSLYMSKNQPDILLKDSEASIDSESMEDNISVTSISKRNFFTSLFDKSNGINRKLSTKSLESGKSKNIFLGRRFSMSSANRSNSIYRNGTRESSVITMPEAISISSLNEKLNE